MTKDMFEFPDIPPLKRGMRMRTTSRGFTQYWIVERRRKNKVWVKLDILKMSIKSRIER